MWQQKSTSWSPLKFLDSLKSLWGNLKSFPLSESSVNRSKIYLSFQNKHPIFLNDFMEIRLPSPCFSALSPEPLEIQTLRENLPTYSKPGPGWHEVVNCYWMTEWAVLKDFQEVGGTWWFPGPCATWKFSAVLGQVPGAMGGRMPTPLTLQMLWFQGRKAEVKQSLMGQMAGRTVISLLPPQTHYLQ